MGLSNSWDNSYLNNCRSPPDETSLNNNNQENIEVNALQSVNILIMTIVITQLAPLPQPSSSLRDKKICMYSLDTSRRQFSITPKNEYQDQ